MRFDCEIHKYHGSSENGKCPQCQSEQTSQLDNTILMEIFSELHGHNGDCYCGDCDTKLFSDLKNIEHKYYSALNNIEKL